MAQIVPFPKIKKQGELSSTKQKLIKANIDMHHDLMDVLYQIEVIILHDVQTDISTDALQGLYDVVKWNYDRTQRLSNSL